MNTLETRSNMMPQQTNTSNSQTKKKVTQKKFAWDAQMENKQSLKIISKWFRDQCATILSELTKITQGHNQWMLENNLKTLERDQSLSLIINIQIGVHLIAASSKKTIARMSWTMILLSWMNKPTRLNNWIPATKVWKALSALNALQRETLLPSTA